MAKRVPRVQSILGQLFVSSKMKCYSVAKLYRPSFKYCFEGRERRLSLFIQILYVPTTFMHLLVIDAGY